MVAAIAIGNAAQAQGQLGQLVRNSSGGSGLLILKPSQTGTSTYTLGGPTGNIITSHLDQVNLLTGASSGTFSVNGTAGTPNITLTSLGGTARTSITSGYDRLLLANSTGLVDAVSINDVIGSSAWRLAGNGTTDAWNGTAGAFMGTTSAQPLSIATTNSTAQAIQFYTGNSGANLRMIIGANGGVGIGLSAAPTQSFAVGTGTTTNFSVVGATGNTSVGGTLDVTGATTITGALNANGNVAVNTNKLTIDAATGNTAIAGTLNTTGLLTAAGGATVNGNTVVTGVTNINFTGSNATTIGNLSLVGLGTASSSDSVLLVGNTQVKKMAVSTLTGNVTVSEQSLTAAYTLTANDYMISCTNAGTGTVTLPTPTAVGKVYIIKSSAAGDITVSRTGSDTIDGASSYTIPGGSGLSLTFVYVASGKWAVVD
ncbi:hypothetical protein SAMN05444008_107264 [Cnuella takakiae]|uniref:Uncharacterized protein n=2 Tax=Cnuella takakiae TaxID=1302690 RepID=A0A1M5BDK4_9BACT|nr:hypothetical protein BUE76_17275 [Cnuella takakiae]SHF40516.1 hypothetical protein SAMN05444008_107264 [Cnuella takakiae]